MSELNDMTPLEEEYAKVVAEVTPKIKEKLKEAMKLLGEAEVLAEESGVQFAGPLSPASQTYSPYSLENGKFKELDYHFVCEITGTYHNYRDYLGGGWEHSQVGC